MNIRIVRKMYEKGVSIKVKRKKEASIRAKRKRKVNVRIKRRKKNEYKNYRLNERHQSKIQTRVFVSQGNFLSNFYFE